MMNSNSISLDSVREELGTENGANKYLLIDNIGKPRIFSEFQLELYKRPGVIYGLRDFAPEHYELEDGIFAICKDDPNYVTEDEIQSAIFNNGTCYVHSLLLKEAEARQQAAYKLSDAQSGFYKHQLSQIQIKELFDALVSYCAFSMDIFVPLDMLKADIYTNLAFLPNKEREDVSSWLLRYVPMPASFFSIESIVLSEQRKLAERLLSGKGIDYDAFAKLYGFLTMDHYFRASFDEAGKAKGFVEQMAQGTALTELRRQMAIDKMAAIETVNEHAVAIDYLIEHYNGDKKRLFALLSFVERSYEHNEYARFFYTHLFKLAQDISKTLTLDIATLSVDRLSKEVEMLR